jgi:hypothetical protein
MSRIVTLELSDDAEKVIDEMIRYFELPTGKTSSLINWSLAIAKTLIESVILDGKEVYLGVKNQETELVLSKVNILPPKQPESAPAIATHTDDNNLNTHSDDNVLVATQESSDEHKD